LRGVIELNRKILGILLALMILAMLATPLVGTVMAGKGQNKLDYKGTFRLRGYTVPIGMYQRHQKMQTFGL